MTAKSNSELLDHLLFALGHELASPLTVLSFNLEILSLAGNRDPVELQKQRLHRCLAAAQKMRSTLELIRQAQSLERGHIQIEKRAMTLKRCWERALESFQEQIQEKEVQIHVSDWSEDDQILGHMDLLVGQVFPVLISSVLRLSPRGGTVWVGCESKVRDKIVFYIADEGPGIIGKKVPQPFDLQELPIIHFFLSFMGASMKIHTRQQSLLDDFHGTLYELHFPRAPDN